MRNSGHTQEFSTARYNHLSVFVDLPARRVRILSDPGSTREIAEAIRRQQQSAGVRLFASAAK